MRGDFLFRALSEHPWALLPGYMDTLADVLERHILGVSLTDQELEAKIGRPRGERQSEDFAVTNDGIAVLPLHGVISHRMNLMADISGGTSTEKFGHLFGALMDDPQIKGITLDVNSPGGSVYGLDELHAQMMESRGRKPVVAHVSPMAASAAYWLASAADSIVVDPGGDVGSVGVFALHRDYSESDAKEGIKTTIVRSRKFKAEGNPHEPLSDDARKAMQARVDEADERFYAAIAVGRGLPKATVEGGFGQGRLLSAKEALKVGMVDRIATRGQTLSALSASLGTKSSPQITANAAATSQEPEQATDQELVAHSVWLARTKLALCDL